MSLYPYLDISMGVKSWNCLAYFIPFEEKLSESTMLLVGEALLIICAFTGDKLSSTFT